MSLACKWLSMGTDVWRKYSEWLDCWRLSKRRKSFVLGGTNPAPKHLLSQMNMVSCQTPSNWCRTCWHSSVNVLSLVRVCGNGHLPLSQSELEAQIGRTLSLLPIPPHVHRPGKGGAANLLLQKGCPTVEMDHCNATAVKGMAISPRIVRLGISIG